MSDPETIRVYDDRAKDYADLTDDQVTDDPKLAAFIAACPDGGRVLDLGCGPGAAAAAMAQAGLKVEAWDASSEMVAMAARHPGVSARQAVFDDISGHDVYDGIWASFSLLHAPRGDFPSHLKALHKALKPGGTFVIGMKTGTGQARDSLGRLYTYYTVLELEKYLTEAGFTPTSQKVGTGKGLDGNEAEYVLVTAHG
ncbi:MAG: SAM-dependent methyltransferase [Rhodobacteraceae bacterium]|nr:MAG: SAM-dependent methyltransferase [Paracoccaceae bacterium]